MEVTETGAPRCPECGADCELVRTEWTTVVRRVTLAGDGESLVADRGATIVAAGVQDDSKLSCTSETGCGWYGAAGAVLDDFAVQLPSESAALRQLERFIVEGAPGPEPVGVMAERWDDMGRAIGSMIGATTIRAGGLVGVMSTPPPIDTVEPCATGSSSVDRTQRLMERAAVHGNRLAIRTTTLQDGRLFEVVGVSDWGAGGWTARSAAIRMAPQGDIAKAEGLDDGYGSRPFESPGDALFAVLTDRMAWSPDRILVEAWPLAPEVAQADGFRDLLERYEQITGAAF